MFYNGAGLGSGSGFEDGSRRGCGFVNGFGSGFKSGFEDGSRRGCGFGSGNGTENESGLGGGFVGIGTTLIPKMVLESVNKRSKKIRSDKMNNAIEKDLIGKYVIVRTYSAGVKAGILIAKEGKECLLEQSRRLWGWEGAASLSDMAVNGTSLPDKCNFPVPVEKELVTEVIEILLVTEKGRKSIEEVPIWTMH